MKPFIPNAETIEAGLRGEVFACNTIEELFEELKREDDADLPTEIKRDAY